MDVEETLARTPLFQKLPPRHLRSLAKLATTRTYQPGQVIVAEGQTGFGLYSIQSGKVKVTKQTPGGEREIRTMGPGETFGEISLLDDQPRSATVTAVEPTTAVLLDKMQFGAELRTHPEVALSLLPALVQWLREADRKISELT
jgi:CRP-like cAMP-binding protein